MKKETAVLIIVLLGVLSLVIFINNETSEEKRISSYEKKENKTEVPEKNNSGEKNCSKETCRSTDRYYEKEEIQNKDLPEDLESSECGYYYEEYGICSGKCPRGKCVSKGESCYCVEQ